VEKCFSLTYLPVCGVNLGAFVDDTWYFDAHPEKTKWKDSWKRYLGTYGYPLFAQPVWYARLALSLGLPRNGFLRVRRQGDGMAADGVPLLEQEPGLFFSKTGEALDFRSDPPTWRNVKLQKRWRAEGRRRGAGAVSASRQPPAGRLERSRAPCNWRG
jgi:hypothetical protein